MMTKALKVMLWGQEDVMGQAVELFLSTRHHWEIIRILNTEHNKDLVEEVKKHKPDVVILNPNNCGEAVDFPMQLMADSPQLKVLAVSLENNLLQIYNKQNICIRQVSDLLAAIESSVE